MWVKQKAIIDHVGLKIFCLSSGDPALWGDFVIVSLKRAVMAGPVGHV